MPNFLKNIKIHNPKIKKMFANYRISYLCRIWNLQLRKLQVLLTEK